MEQRFNALGQPIAEPVSGEFPRPMPPRTPMQGRYCSVVPLDIDAHCEPLFQAYAEDREDRIWTYLPYGPFENAGAYRDWMQATCCDDETIFYTILDSDGAPVGLAAYLRMKPEYGVIEIGHINYAPRLQRSAAATEAQFLFMCRAFDELGYRRYEWKSDTMNKASLRAGQRLGFLYEGTFRQAQITKGRNRDTAWYSILDHEWPDIRARFQDWLRPDNFNADGSQKTALKLRPETGPYRVP